MGTKCGQATHKGTALTLFRIDERSRFRALEWKKITSLLKVDNKARLRRLFQNICPSLI